MKLKPVLRESLRLYKKNLPDLLLTLLLELALRAAALTPLLCLASKDLAWGALACIPLYLLIVLPARQNFALALQDMLRGGRLLSVQLVSVDQYGQKLLRGLIGTGKILLWSALSIAGIAAMAAIYLGVVDGFTALRLFSKIGGGSTTDGIMLSVGIIAATLVLPVIGCAVHSGRRHAFAMGDAKLVKGRGASLTALWMAGLAMLLPFAAVLAVTVGDMMLSVVKQMQNVLMGGKLALNVGGQVYIILAAVIVLLLPVIPMKSMLPAVALRLEKEKNDAAA